MNKEFPYYVSDALHLAHSLIYSEWRETYDSGNVEKSKRLAELFGSITKVCTEAHAFTAKDDSTRLCYRCGANTAFFDMVWAFAEPGFEPNMVYCKDCADVISKLPEEFVDES